MMLDFSQFKALTFDCYGTLIDWENGILNALRPVLQNHNIQISDNQTLEIYADFESRAEAGDFKNYRTILQMTMDSLGEEFGFSPTLAERDCLADSIQNWQPFADTVTALKALKTRYQLGILSNIDDDLFSHSARHLQVEFDWIITAQQLGSYKPSLNNFQQAIHRIGLPKEQVLHIAQSLFHDIAPAKEMELTTVWVNRRRDVQGFGATPKATAKPDLEVPNLQSLTERMYL